MHIIFHSTHNNIPGVLCIDSGKPGPILGIWACTHGGEVVGLDIIDFLLEKLDIKNMLQSGKIFFSLNNIPAYEKYLETGDVVGSRFVEENLNRACSVENMLRSNSPEIQRARQLEPLLAKLEFYLDIHSTYSPSESIGIFSKNGFERFWKVFNVSMGLVGINEKLVGKPFMDIVERNWGIWLWIEAGSQFDNQWYTIGVDNVLRLLHSLDMITLSENIHSFLLPEKIQKTFLIFDTVIVKNEKFQSEREFVHWEELQKWERIGFNGEEEIFAQENLSIIMPAPKKMYQRCIGEEFCFLGRRI